MRKHKWDKIEYPKTCLRCKAKLSLNHPLNSCYRYSFETDKAILEIKKLSEIPECK